MERATRLALLILLTVLANIAGADQGTADAAFTNYFGYATCIRLENGDTRVILCPEAGGRVLEYSWKGKNALYLDPAQKGWHYEPGKPVVEPCGGRFDIGPEMIIPRHPDLWFGKWAAEPIGPKTNLAPGESASFTEEWWLVPHKFPEPRHDVDLKALSQTVSGLFGTERPLQDGRPASLNHRHQASAFDVTTKKKEDQVKVQIEGEKAVERSSPLWMDIKLLDAKGRPTKKIPLEGGYFEVTLPGALLHGQPEPLIVQWIDFYR